MLKRSTTARLALAAAILAMPDLGQQTHLAARRNAANEVLAPPVRPQRKRTPSQALQGRAERRRLLRGLRNVMNAWRSAEGHFCPAKRAQLLDFYSRDACRVFEQRSQSIHSEKLAA